MTSYSKYEYFGGNHPSQTKPTSHPTYLHQNHVQLSNIRFLFLGRPNKNNINLQATFIVSTKTITETISLDIFENRTKLRKTITPPTIRPQMKFLLSVLQCTSLCLKNQRKSTFKSASSACFKFTLRARKMQISSDRLVVKPARLTFTLFWRENFPSCLDHCFEYLEREILEKNSKHGLKNTSPRKTALMVTHSVPLSVGCLSTRV